MSYAGTYISSQFINILMWCVDCGVYVHDTVVHDGWHSNQAKTRTLAPNE